MMMMMMKKVKSSCSIIIWGSDIITWMPLCYACVCVCLCVLINIELFCSPFYISPLNIYYAIILYFFFYFLLFSPRLLFQCLTFISNWMASKKWKEAEIREFYFLSHHPLTTQIAFLSILFFCLFSKLILQFFSWNILLNFWKSLPGNKVRIKEKIWK